MKRILVLNSSVSGGGAGKALIEYIKALDLSLLEIHVLLPFDGRVGDELRKVGAKVHYLSYLPERFGKTYVKIPGFLRKSWIESLINIASFPFFIWKIQRLVKELDIDLIFGNHQIHSPVAIGAGRLSRRPVAIYSREVIEGFWPRWYFLWITRSPFLKRVFSVSQVSADLYQPTGKTKVVLDCIDVDEVRASANRELKSKFKMADDDIVIGYLGRIIQRKGVPLLIQAFSHIASELPKAKLVIVGGNDPGLHHDLLEQYREQVRGLGLADRIIFTGFYPKPSNYLVDFDVSVLPSLNPEPFGMVVMEAMCLGVPVVVPDNSGVAEVIRDGLDGLHFKAMDAKSLGEVLKRIVLDEQLKAEIGENGHRRARELFDPRTRKDNITQTILDLLPRDEIQKNEAAVA